MLLGGLSGARQHDPKCRALANLTSHGDLPSQTRYDSVNYWQAQAAPLGFRRKERVEDLGLRLRRHTATGIGYFELKIIARRYLESR